MKNIFVIIFLLFAFQYGYSCMCLVEYDLLLPADLILKENNAVAFEGQVVKVEHDSVKRHGHFHTIAYFKILNWYKGEYTSDTIPVHYYNDSSTCDVGYPNLDDKYLIAEIRDETTQELTVGFCSFYEWFWDDDMLKKMAKKQGTLYDLFLKYYNEPYFEMKAFFEQLTSPQKDGAFEIRFEYRSKQQLVVEGKVLNGAIKSAKVYDKYNELAFMIETSK